MIGRIKTVQRIIAMVAGVFTAMVTWWNLGPALPRVVAQARADSRRIEGA